MNAETAVSSQEIDSLFLKVKKEAETAGYFLNPDTDFSKALIKSLLVNKRRYGYQACPCRLSDGDKNADLDIICPCYYRDADVEQYGACY